MTEHCQPEKQRLEPPDVEQREAAWREDGEEYGRIVEAVARWLRRRFPGTQNADDWAQEAMWIFLAAINAGLLEERGPEASVACVRIIAARCASDHFRRESRARIARNSDEDLTQIQDPGADPAEQVGWRDQGAAARSKLSALPPMERQILELQAAGLTMKEISVLLDLDIGTDGKCNIANIRASRARQKLRKGLSARQKETLITHGHLSAAGTRPTLSYVKLGGIMVHGWVDTRPGASVDESGRLTAHVRIDAEASSGPLVGIATVVHAGEVIQCRPSAVRLRPYNADGLFQLTAVLALPGGSLATCDSTLLEIQILELGV